MKKDLLFWTWWAWEPVYFYRRVNRAPGIIELPDELMDEWYENIHAEETVVKMKDLGINCAVTHFYKGFGIEFEKHEMKRTAKFVELCHRYGIKVFGYIQYGSIFHEELFKEIPEAVKWIQIDNYGKPRLWYNNDFRYLPCIEQLAFFKYLKKCIKLGICDTGLDGLHFDNFYSHPCYCDTCKNNFVKYLHTNHPELLSQSNGEIPSEAVLTLPTMTNPVVNAWIQFRRQAMNRRMHEIKSYAKKLNPDIMLLYNPSVIRGLQDQAKLRSTDIWDIGNQAQFMWAEGGNYPGIRKKCLLHQVNFFKTAEATGSRVLSTTWMHHSEGNGFPTKIEDIGLNIAESAMFNAEPGVNWLLRANCEGKFLADEKRALTNEVKKCFRFIKENQNLYTGSHSCAETALYLNASSRRLKFKQTYGTFLATQQILLQRHIPFNLVFSEQKERIFDYSVLILPEIISLEDEEKSILDKFIQKGGKLMFIKNYDRSWDMNIDKKNISLYSPKTDWVAGIDGDYTTYVYLPNDTDDFIFALDELSKGERAVKIHAPETVVTEFRLTDTGKHLVHLLNYCNTEKIVDATVQIDNNLLPAFQDSKFISPDCSKQKTLIGEQLNNHITYTIPEFETYGVLILRKD